MNFVHKLLGTGLSSKRLIGLLGSIGLIVNMFITGETHSVLILTLFALGAKTFEKTNTNTTIDGNKN